MAQDPVTYIKLPGKRRRIIVGRDTAYLGPDHLLTIESSGFSEQYKRYYFKDIQAINIIKTRKATITNSILLVLMIGLSVWGAFLYPGEMAPLSVFLWIISAVMLVYFIMNAPQGASCEVWIHTRVQKEKIPSLYASRIVNKAMKILVPAIEKVQGTLGGENLKNARNKLYFKKDDQFTPGTRVKIPRVQQTGGSLIWHRISFPMTMISGALIAVAIVYRPPLFLAFASIWMLSGFAVAVVAGAVQTRTGISGTVKAATWASAGAYLVILVIGYVETVVGWVTMASELDPFQTQNQWEMFKVYSKMDVLGTPWMFWLNTVQASILMMIGAAGLFLFYKDQNR